MTECSYCDNVGEVCYCDDDFKPGTLLFESDDLNFESYYSCWDCYWGIHPYPEMAHYWCLLSDTSKYKGTGWTTFGETIKVEDKNG